MLVLTRQAGQRIRIGDDIWLTIGSVDRNQVKVLIDAPTDVSIVREELIGRPRRVTTPRTQAEA